MNNIQSVAILAAVLAGSSLTSVGLSAAEDASQVRDVEAFTKVSSRGSMDIDIKAGESQRVEVIADSRDIDAITTEVRGDKLVVSVKRRHRLHDDVRVVVSVAKLEGVSLNGSGDITARGVKADEFEAGINGSGDIMLVGTCGEADYEINGSGDIKAEDMKCKSVDVEINGSGDMAISAEDYISVEINGSGDVKVIGEPRLRKFSSRGSGSIDMN